MKPRRRTGHAAIIGLLFSLIVIIIMDFLWMGGFIGDLSSEHDMSDNVCLGAHERIFSSPSSRWRIASIWPK
jgi:hypothetical protein